MTLNRDKLYLFLMFTCLIGASWIFVNLRSQIHYGLAVNTCLFKNLTTIPCPSCGSTRSVIYLLQGRFADAFLLNPIGYLFIPFLTLTPTWIVIDWISNKDTLYKFYRKTELFIQKKTVSWLLIILILVNWIWNIVKNN